MTLDTGARKLLDAEALSKMVPVDEFLPIMYDRYHMSFFGYCGKFFPAHFPAITSVVNVFSLTVKWKIFSQNI